MRQAEIMALLREAADPKCHWSRHNFIAAVLQNAVIRHDPEEEEDSAPGFHVAVNSLFFDTVRNRPQILPSLFPAFALLCGDREENMAMAEIDWVLMDSQ